MLPRYHSGQLFVQHFEQLARQESTQSEYEAARDAERIANKENEAWANDESYMSWSRRKKLAERDLARLDRELEVVADEIQAEEGARSGMRF